MSSQSPSQSSSRSFEVELVPAVIQPRSLEGRVVVVVDVLRATSTIASALAAGATCVLPMPDLDSARQRHQQEGPESRLGGERSGRKVDGFHCGNSPREYTPEIISGRKLILATTNGTVAMESCRAAAQIVTGAFTNISAVEYHIADHSQVTILCSGTDGRITGEDVLFAGAIGCRLQARAGNHTGHSEMEFQTNDGAEIAMTYWRHVQHRIESENLSLADVFREAHGGRHLVRKGYDADVVYAAGVDVHDIVPVLDVESWSIRPA